MYICVIVITYRYLLILRGVSNFHHQKTKRSVFKKQSSFKQLQNYTCQLFGFHYEKNWIIFLLPERNLCHAFHVIM